MIEKIKTFTYREKGYTLFMYKKCYYAMATYDDSYLSYEIYKREYIGREYIRFSPKRTVYYSGVKEFRFTVLNNQKESAWFYCYRIAKSKLSLMEFLSEVIE